MSSEREYAGAVEGMLETSEPPFAVGDLVSGTTKGKAWSGTICGIDGAWLNVTVDSGLLMVPAADVTSRARVVADAFALGDEITFRMPGWPVDSSARGLIVERNMLDNTVTVQCEGHEYEINPAVWPAGDRLEV
jgi:hypothetical protein